MPSIGKPTRMHKFLNVFICFYRFLTEKFLWPRNYAVYAELPDLFQVIDKEEQRPNRKMWYTGKFSGAIFDTESEQPSPMSKRRAERLVSSFSGGKVKQISPDPVWFSVTYFIFFWILPLPFSAYFYFKRVLSGPINRLNYSFLVKCSKGANLQEESLVIRGAEIIQNQIYLFYDRALNTERFPPFSDFLVLVCGEERKVNGMGYAGTRRDFPDIVRLMLITSVDAGEEVKVFYVPREDSIEDLHGNPRL